MVSKAGLGGVMDSESRWRTPIVVAISVVVAWCLLVVLGTSAPNAASLSLILIVQIVGGAFWWVRAARRGPDDVRVPVAELIGMGVAVGTALSLACSLALQPISLGRLGWLTPAIAAALLVVAERLRGRKRRILLTSSRPESAALLIGLVAATATIWLGVRHYPLYWTAAAPPFHEDLVLLEALGKSLAEFGSGNFTLLAGIPVRYHWLAFAWSGQAEAAFDTAPFVALTRALPLVAAAGLVGLAASLPRFKSGRPWVPTLSVLLVIAGAHFGADVGSAIIVDSPSHSMSSMWLVGTVFAFAVWMNGGDRESAPLLVAIGGLAFVVTGAKFSAGAVAVAGLIAVAMMLTVTRSPLRLRSQLALAVALVGSALAYFILMSGISSSFELGSLTSKASTLQGLDPTSGALGATLGTIAILFAVATRWSGSLWLTRGASSWRSWEAPLVVGMWLAGLLPIILLSHGINEMWFAAEASAPLAVFAAIGVGCAWTPIREASAGRLVSAFAAIALLSATTAWLAASHTQLPIRFAIPFIPWVTGAAASIVIALRRGPRPPVGAALAALLVIPTLASLGSRLLLNLPATPEPAQSASAPDEQKAFAFALPRIGGWSAGDADAAGRLVELAGPGSIVATNNPRDAWLPAMTGLPMYVAGVGTVHGMVSSDYMPLVQTRVKQVQSLLGSGTSAPAVDMCEQGVKWIWIEKALDPAPTLTPHATIAYENDDVLLAQLTGTGCSK